MLQYIRSKQFLSELFAGAVISFLLLTYIQSVTCLIYTGEARPYLSIGLFSSLATSFLLTVYLHVRGAPKQSIYLVQDLPAIIIAMALPSLFKEMQELNLDYSPFSTIVAMFATFTLLLGISLFLGSLFKIGNIIRYFPFTVMVGFLGGVCLLLMKGAISIIMNQPTNLHFLLEEAWQFEAIVRWQPVVLFGIVLFCSTRLFPSPLTLPTLLLLGIFFFFITLYFFDISIEKAQELGLLLGGGKDENIVKFLKRELHFSYIHWELIFGNLGYSFIIILIVFVNMILNASTYETTFEKSYPLNWELTQCGIGNIATSTLFAIPAYSTILSIALCNILGAVTRIPALICMVTFFVALLLGDSLFSLLPIPIMASLTFYIGIHFFIDLIVDKRKQLSIPEYLLVIISSLVIALWNLPMGILLALIGMAFLFVFEYSRMKVVMQEMDGTVYKSNVERSYVDQKLLEDSGQKLSILRIQGYVFFGTANRVLTKLYQRLNDHRLPPLHSLILDFECVSKVDYSAIMHLKKIIHLAETSSFYLMYAGMNEEIIKQMKDGGCIEENNERIAIFDNFDESVKHFEDRQLEMSEIFHGDPIKELFSQIFNNPWEIDFFISLLEEQFAPGDMKVFQQGDSSKGMYFIQSGEIEIWGESKHKHESIKLSTLMPGTYFGEMAFFTDSPRTASAIAKKKTKLYFLSKDHLNTIKLENINLFIKFQSYIIQRLSYRLNRSNEECYFLIQTYLGG